MAEPIYKIKDFIKSSKGIDYLSNNEARIYHNGDFITLFNKLTSPLSFRYKRKVRKWGKDEWGNKKKLYDKFDTDKTFTLSKGKSKTFTVKEGRRRTDAKYDYDLFLTLSGVGAEGYGVKDEVDVPAETNVNMFLRDYGYYIAIIFVIIVALIMIAILWRQFF